MEQKLVFGWRKTRIYLKEKEEERTEKKQKRHSLFHWFEYGVDAILGIFFQSKEKFWWTFVLSIVFVVGLSWQIVDSAIVVANVLQVPEAIIALTILGVGTSIPDFFTSFLVAKDGRGNMAVNNAIGSNIFDILFGLGFPWFLWIIINQQEVTLSREGLISSVLLLCGFVLLFFLLSRIQKWNLNRWGGSILMISYLIYLGWKISEALM
jgi:Ca2+/Na+ antiporter